MELGKTEAPREMALQQTWRFLGVGLWIFSFWGTTVTIWMPCIRLTICMYFKISLNDVGLVALSLRFCQKCLEPHAGCHW